MSYLRGKLAGVAIFIALFLFVAGEVLLGVVAAAIGLLLLVGIPKISAEPPTSIKGDPVAQRPPPAIHGKRGERVSGPDTDAPGVDSPRHSDSSRTCPRCGAPLRKSAMACRECGAMGIELSNESPEKILSRLRREFYGHLIAYEADLNEGKMTTARIHRVRAESVLKTMDKAGIDPSQYARELDEIGGSKQGPK